VYQAIQQGKFFRIVENDPGQVFAIELTIPIAGFPKMLLNFFSQSQVRIHDQLGGIIRIIYRYTHRLQYPGHGGFATADAAGKTNTEHEMNFVQER
jgi:hypothetical protein